MNSIVKDIESDGHLTLEQASGFKYQELEKHQILFIHDRLDQVNPFSRTTELHKLIPHSAIFETENLGHNRILRSELVIAKTLEFIVHPKIS